MHLAQGREGKEKEKKKRKGKSPNTVQTNRVILINFSST
jgi:hypothetical protein